MRFFLLPLSLVLLVSNMVAADDTGDVWVGIFSRIYAGAPTIPILPMGAAQSIGSSIKEKIAQAVVNGGINALLKNGVIPQPTVDDKLIARDNDDKWSDIFWNKGNTNKVSTLKVIYEGEGDREKGSWEEMISQLYGVMKFTVPRYAESVTAVRKPGDEFKWDVYSDSTDRIIGDCQLDAKKCVSRFLQLITATPCERQALCYIRMDEYYMSP